MANKNNKNNTKIKYLKTKQNVKIKSGEFSTALSIILPIVGVFAFLVGGILLFMHMDESRRLPDTDYLAAERLVDDGVLIGLTLEECVEAVGSIAFINENDGDWVFMAGHKAFFDGQGRRSYEICVKHENGVAVSAVLRRAKD
ncbi:MAG: hypothetical protein FWH07_03870 [Oscillospiraceae bacterium]|nr:hypothetical protein [Oscillospiraceae bacterium]